MNLLIVCHYGLYSDLSASFVHHQARAYAELGHKVRVIIPTPVGKVLGGKRVGSILTKTVVDGVTLCYLRFPSFSNFGTRTGLNIFCGKLALSGKLSSILDGFQPDVIHAHTLGFDSELGAWLKERLHCPLVVTTHGSDSSIPMEQGQYQKMKRFCDRADHVVAVSSRLAERLLPCGTQTPISVILNGFVLDNLPSKMEKKPFSMIQVGHLQDQKRQTVTIRAFATLKQQYPAMTLTLVGQGTDRPVLEELCRSLGVADDVRFTGQLPHAVVLSELAKAQFFVMPSVREGFGIVYLEAMACGCVTIGTEGEGIADLIESGRNGFLVPPDNPDAIADVIRQSLQGSELADHIAATGRQDASALTWGHNAAQYLDLFRWIAHS